MKRMKFLIKKLLLLNLSIIIAGVLFLAVSIFAFGCASAPTDNGIPLPTDNGISEISLKRQTGLLGVSSTVTFLQSGTARCECSFYNLNENDKPRNENAETLCGELYKNKPSAFTKTKKNLQGVFVGKLSYEEFERISQLVRINDFFRRSEKPEVEVLTDAPPDILTMVSGGKTKMVFDNGGNSGEKLSEIKSAIYRSAKEIKWESELK